MWQVAVHGLVELPGRRGLAHDERRAGDPGRDHREGLAALAVERSHRTSPIGTAVPDGTGSCGAVAPRGGRAVRRRAPRARTDATRRARRGASSSRGLSWRWLTRRNAAA